MISRLSQIIVVVCLLCLTSCTITGKARVRVCVVEQKSMTPLANYPLELWYQTVWPAPMARPNHMVLVTDAKGCAIFGKLADGAWSLRTTLIGDQVQKAHFTVHNGTLIVFPPPTFKDVNGRLEIRHPQAMKGHGTIIGEPIGKHTPDPNKTVVFHITQLE